MAETAQTPAPGTHPDAVVVNDDGSVTQHGRKAWIWVHDETSGARYDVPAAMLPRKGLRVVDGYPVNLRPQARAPKPALLLGDVAASPGRVSIAGEQPVDARVAAARVASAATSTTSEPLLPAGPVGGEQSEAGATPATEPVAGDQPAGEPTDAAGTDAGDQATAAGDAGDQAETTTTTTRKGRSAR
jgi:hypothetical protein